MIRNASALMLSTVASSAAGFLFWVVAARVFPAATVGRASALIAAVTLLAALAQLNLVSLFARFLPTAGRDTRRIVVRGYAASAVMATLLAVGFVSTGWGARLAGVPPVLFTVAVVAGAQLFIQDGVLTAVRRAAWVPVKNALTAGLKLVLLPVLAGASVAGMFLAWAVPVIAVMLAVNLWVLVRLVPAHARGMPPGVAGAGTDGVAGFVTAEYVNGLISNAVAFLPPVLVATRLGDVASARFYLPWVVGVAVTTLLWNLVTSYVVEASGPTGHDRAHLDRAIRLGVLVVVPGTLVLTLAAGPLLSVFGAGYAAAGTTALRLIGLALPCTAVVLLYAASAMMAKRMWPLAAVQLVSAAAFLAGAWLSVERLGTTGPALAYLVAQAGAAAAVLPTVLRHYRAAAPVAVGAA